MEEEKIKELLDFLKSLGFESPQLESDIRKNMQLNVPGFDAKHSIIYGEEQMRFELRFRLDPQFNSYRLTQYKAIHRDPLVIEHKVINGIDTAQLEESMKDLNWGAYFDSIKNNTEVSFKNQCAETISLLNKLTELQDFDGIKIREELMFKYWPETVYNLSSRENLKSVYEKYRDLSPSEWGMCNANLAFHILSGRFDDIMEKMSTLNLDEFPGADLYYKLEEFLSRNPDQFEFKFSHNTPDGFIEYNIPVTKIDGWYSVNTYQTILIPYSPIEHGIYNGINTKELEDQMKKVNWKNLDDIAILHDNEEPEFLPRIDAIQQQISTLQHDPDGLLISQQLQLKYWTEAVFFDNVIDENTWKYFDAIPKREQSFPVGLDGKSAFNLLCGRAILHDQTHPMASDKPAWVKFDLTTLNANGGYLTDIMIGFDRDDLEATLKVLPIPSGLTTQITDLLAKGDIVPVNLLNGKTILLEANPEQKTINIYSEDMRPISVNLHFDPNWKPAQNPELKPEELKRKSRQNIIHSEYPSSKGNQIRRRR